MKKLTCVLAILAAASTAAVAKDLKQDKKTTPAPSVKATVMSDAEMDKVTAGDVGNGVNTAAEQLGHVVPAVQNGFFAHAIPATGKCVGLGTITAAGASC
jgi:hypothetical protein